MPKKIDLTGSSQCQEISIEALQSQVTRYTQERYKYLTSNIGCDSRQVWIDRSKLQEFLDSNPAADGVRMYFGVTDVVEPGFDAGVHNLLLVATQNQNNEDTDLLNDSDWVLVFEVLPEHSASKTLVNICPPPNNGCKGALATS